MILINEKDFHKNELNIKDYIEKTYDTSDVKYLYYIIDALVDEINELKKHIACLDNRGEDY